MERELLSPGGGSIGEETAGKHWAKFLSLVLWRREETVGDWKGWSQALSGTVGQGLRVTDSLLWG